MRRRCSVLRDGRETEVARGEVVPATSCCWHRRPHRRACALIDAVNLQAQEAALTASRCVEKRTERSPAPTSPS